jgi:hypothetical protein
MDSWRKVLNTSFIGMGGWRPACCAPVHWLLLFSVPALAARWLHLALAQILLEFDNGNHIVFLCTSVL